MSIKVSKSSTIEKGSEKRGLRRNPYSGEDRITLHIGQSVYARVLNLNSTGALIEVSDLDRNSLRMDSGKVVHDCQILSNTAIIGAYPSAIVCHITNAENDHYHVGLCFCSQKMESKENVENRGIRSSLRLRTRDNIVPVGYFDNPVVYNDKLHFQVRDVSKNGAQLSTSARNQLVLVGSTVEGVRLFLPTIGEVSVKMRIAWTRKRAGEDILDFGVEFLERSEDFDGKMSRYLVAFSPDPNDLVKKISDNFGISKGIKREVTYSLVHTEDEYQQVLSLRRDAYARAGKIDPSTPASSMADLYDSHSRIVIAKVGGMVVGSVRYTFCTDESHKFELDESIVIPKKFNRQKTFEASRACVAREFEDTNLIHGIFEFGIQLTVKAGIEWVITSCEGKLLGLYGKLGFKPQGVSFTLKTLNNIPHHLIAGDTSVIATGKGMNSIVWYFSFGNVAKFLQSMGHIESIRISPMKRLVTRVVLFFLRPK